MFNVAVVNIKDLIRYVSGILFIILIIVVLSKTFGIKQESREQLNVNIEEKVKNISEKTFLGCIDKTMPVVANINEEYNNIAQEGDINEKNSYLEEFLKTELSVIEGIKISEQKNENIEKEITENETNIQEQEKEEVMVAQTGLTTQVITNNPIKENFNTQYGNVKIKNETSYQLTEEMMKPDIVIDNKNILLFHTHSCESYTASEQYPYTPTGNFRTTDLNFTVTRVGTELENQLKQYKYNVIHDTNYHDYPAYNGSYTRSLATVENILKTNQADIIIDVHRDAIGSRSDYAPCVKIGENDVAAQIMFVIGTNDGGLWHPNWNQNLKFAIKIQEKAEEMYPGLFKPIMLTKSRYNQHTGKYASIIEVGATGNTLEQCITSMKYLAKVMDEVMK